MLLTSAAASTYLFYPQQFWLFSFVVSPFLFLHIHAADSMSSSSCSDDSDVNTAWMGGLGETITSGQLRRYYEIVGVSV